MRFWAVPPSQRSGGDLVELGLAGADDELLLSMYGWSTLHRAVEEVLGVVVVGEPANSSMLNGPLLALRQPELVDDVAGLELADLLVVEGRVVVDVLRCRGAAGRRR